MSDKEKDMNRQLGEFKARVESLDIILTLKDQLIEEIEEALGITGHSKEVTGEHALDAIADLKRENAELEERLKENDWQFVQVKKCIERKDKEMEELRTRNAELEKIMEDASKGDYAFDCAFEKLEAENKELQNRLSTLEKEGK